MNAAFDHQDNGASMHISNDRYFRERQRHDLALRMIRHEARTCTIRSCTGLTDDRIRRLYKLYSRHEAHMQLRRRRGKSPRTVSYFTRTIQMQFEASYLRSVFAAFDLLQQPAVDANNDIEYGERFCDAYEAHRQLMEEPRITFEHAWFLLQLLRRKAELRASRCRHCSGRYLRDQINAAARRCPFCELKATEPCIKGDRALRRRPPAAQP